MAGGFFMVKARLVRAWRVRVRLGEAVKAWIGEAVEARIGLARRGKAGIGEGEVIHVYRN